MDGGKAPGPVLVGAEQVRAPDPARLTHLGQNRALVVRRSLLATALGGFIPLPVMDDFVAGRVRAGLYVKLAASRSVDLPQSSADLLADPRDGSALRNATVTAATLLALKLAWKKFFALLAVGRGAEDMAQTFQFATLVDHYCARLHVGGAIGRPDAAEMRRLIFATVDHTGKSALVGAFRDGGRTLGRSVLEAPRWVSERVQSYAERWARTGGRPDLDVAAAAADAAAQAAERDDARWLDRAARLVEERLAGLGNDYLGTLVDRFEKSWRERPKPEPAPPAPAA
jgi:hypothetical protein